MTTVPNNTDEIRQAVQEHYGQRALRVIQLTDVTPQGEGCGAENCGHGTCGADDCGRDPRQGAETADTVTAGPALPCAKFPFSRNKSADLALLLIVRGWAALPVRRCSSDICKAVTRTPGRIRSRHWRGKTGFHGSH